MKKGQSAGMDFLITYGWAIIVVLVALGALAYFGVLTPDKFADTCRCSGINLTYENSKTIDGTNYLVCSGAYDIHLDKYFNSDKFTDHIIIRRDNHLYRCDNDTMVFIE